jgi:hypothetical protein
MSTLTCDHPVPPVVRTKLYGRKICPSCLIGQYIADIQKLQATFERRGGIFASKPDSSKDPEYSRHKQYLKVWRVIKIRCLRDIELLEQLCAEDPKMAREWTVTSALTHWNNARGGLSLVPGLNYLRDDEEDRDHAEEHGTDSTVSANTTTPTKPHQRSALKGHRPSPLESPHTTFSKTSTIITHHSFPTILEPHNKYTTAEFARSRDNFNRNSDSYEPSFWASPHGYEKEDTSHCGTTWYKYQKVMKIGVWEEKKPDVGSGLRSTFEELGTGVGEPESER